jgi:hypothetical protein
MYLSTYHALRFVLPVSCFLGPMNWERGSDPGVFGRFDLAALAQPHLKNFVCLFLLMPWV